ncbi:hypothetical protein AAKU67_002133 [Oxalobacteraceae bacterium GrIS 2.11]
MQKISRQRVTWKCMLGIITLTSLVSCGGGSNSGSGSADTPANHDEIIPVSNGFTRMGLDVDPSGLRVAGDLGATIDSSANITFQTAFNENPQFPYSFTFASGLPGGALAGSISTNLLSYTLGAANKNVKILAPSQTKYVQNVFWTNADNPSVHGFGAAGYRLNPGTLTWPVSGTATYTGKAFQYVVDTYSGSTGSGVSPQDNYGFALYTSSVTATVNYATRTMVMNVAPDAVLQNISDNSSMQGVPGNLLAATINLNEIGFSGPYLEYGFTPYQISGLGLGLDYVDTLNFFGADAQELAGIVEYSSFVPGSTQPVYPGSMFGNTYQTISFALVRQ